LNSSQSNSIGSGRPRGRRNRDAVRETAELYATAVPSVEVEVLEASLRLVAADADALAAFARCLADLGFGKSPGRFAALRNLYFAGTEGLTANELSRQIEVTASNVSYLLQALEEDGLVQRTSDGPDKRFTHVTLTDQGLTLCAKLVPAAARFSSELFSGLSRQEVDDLRNLLKRVQDQARSLHLD
jgi:MarR family 2-MHQ and catechol resistance regulon transcriptional repressor